MLLIIVGGVFILYPGTLLPPNQVSDRTKLVRIAAGNYSSVQVSVGPQETVAVTLSSSPEAVDFFLMNSSDFSTWTARGNPPTNVYPQSSEFNATKYSFSIASTGATKNYTLVFLSRSLNTPNNVLVHLVVDNEADFLQTNVVWIILIACGLGLAVFGATRRKKVVEEPPEEESSQGGGLLGLFGGSGDADRRVAGTCRRCGAKLEEGSSFCPSCGMSQR